jgi:CRISPR system Cascade subunit CasD
MSTLLLHLIGPMQSWGVQSHFDLRDTGLEPSKSGVVGLCAAALGRDRSQPISDIAGLRMGVRVDREGILRYDYQTAQNVIRASGSGRENTVVTKRFYLADAAFLVGLEGDKELLSSIHHALRDPVWPLFLGRKSHVPSESVYLENGFQDASLLEALAQYPPLVKRDDVSFRYVIESSTGHPRLDQPTGPFLQRQFGLRYVQVVEAKPGEVPHVFE